MAYDHGEVHHQAAIKVRMTDKDGGKLVSTTVGRALLYELCPREVPFEAVNKVMGKKQLAELIDLVYRECGQKATVLLADALRTTGYTQRPRPASRSASTTWRSRPRRRSCSTRPRRRSRDRGAVHRGSHHRR
jgi:DNA-directed RNA polymerase beta' subunit